jgi:hypothetical protein
LNDLFCSTTPPSSLFKVQHIQLSWLTSSSPSPWPPHSFPALQVSNHLSKLICLIKLIRIENPCYSLAAPTNATATTPTSSTATGITYAQSATSLLPLPSYAVQSSFATSAAAAIATSLPGYSYNLTSEVSIYPCASRPPASSTPQSPFV